MTLEPWPEVPIGDFAREVTDQPIGDVEVLSVTKHRGFVPSLEYFGKQVFSKDISRYKLVSKGQFAYATIHLDEGSIDALEIRERGAISPMYTVFDVDGSRVDRRFLLELLRSDGMLRRYQEIGQGTVNRRKSIAFATLARERIPLPPLTEQKKIAAILSSVDEAIRANEAVIEQTRRVKEGLLQELLTRGIGHTEFRETEIGPLPVKWRVERLEDLLAPVDNAMRSGPFGSALLKSEWVDEGVPLLGIDNVHVERFVRSYSRFISHAKFQELSRYAVRPKDVMVTIMGTVGRCCVVPDDIGIAVSSKHTWTLTFDQSKYVPYLACAQINYAPWVREKFAGDAQGGAMPAIRSATLKELLLPVPPLEEQQRIEAILEAHEAVATRSEIAANSLRTLKSGLLQDLLTGKVRVTP